MKMIRWILDYWYIPVFAISIWVAGLWSSKTKNRWSLRKELNVIESGRETRQIQIELGEKEALQHVLDYYVSERADLELDNRLKAAELSKDPVALTRFLARVTQ